MSLSLRLAVGFILLLALVAAPLPSDRVRAAASSSVENSGALLAASRSSHRSLPVEWRYPVAGQGIGESGIEVLDLDGDGVAEIILGAQYDVTVRDNDFWYVMKSAGANTYEVAWTSGPYSLRGVTIRRQFAAVPCAGCAPAIFLALSDGTIEVWDGPSLRRKGAFSAGAARALAVGDLDGDGEMEAVTTDGTSIRAHSALGPFTFEWELGDCGGEEIAIGNVDDDPSLEIVTTTSGGPGCVVDGASRQIEWDYVFGFGMKVGLGDTDGDGRLEIAAAEGWYRVNVYDAEVQSLAWEVLGISDIDQLEVSDTDGDGKAEVLVGEGQWGSVLCYGGPDHELLWSIRNPDNGMMGLAAGDADGDGTAEVVWGTGSYLPGYAHLFVGDTAARKLEWQSAQIDGPLSAVDVGDVDDDGRLEIAMAPFSVDGGYGNSFLQVFDAETHQLEWRAPCGSAGFSGMRAVLIGDVDDDGRTELVATTSYASYDGYLLIYDGATHAEKAATPRYHREFTSLAAGDVDGDGGTEIVAGQAYRFYDQVGIRVVVFDGADATEEWQSGDLALGKMAIHDVAVADVDGDGRPEILATVAGGELHLFDGVTHAHHTTRGTRAFALAPFDLNDDGRTEIFVGEAGGAVGVYEGRSLTLKTRYSFGKGDILGLAVVDMDRDRKPEMILSDGTSLFVHDAASGALLSKNDRIGKPVAGFNQIRVKNIRGDGAAEVVLAAGYALYELGAHPAANRNPVASAGGPYKVVLGDAIQLDASASYDPDGIIALYAWDFDGGGKYDWYGEARSVTHVFPGAGSYKARLRVTDDAGSSSSAVVRVEVAPAYLSLASPDGGEIAASGEHVPIRWDNDGRVDTVALSYSLTGKKPWKLIAGGLPAADHEFEWTIPPLKREASRCRVRILGYDASGRKLVSDLSDGTLTLVP